MQALRGQRARTSASRHAACVVERGNDADQEQTPTIFLSVERPRAHNESKYCLWKCSFGFIFGLLAELQDFGRPNTKFHFNRVRGAPLAATAIPYMSFPDLPFFPNPQAVQLFDTNELRPITNLDFDTSRDFFQLNLSLDLAEAQALEKRTVLQGESKEWLEQQKLCLTASSLGKVFHRVHRPSEATVKSLFANKDLSKVRAIAHGKAKERVARSIFAYNMQKETKTFTVFDAGLCVNSSLPYLGACPDGKIYDPLADPCYGLVEIKCSFSKRADTLEQASADPTFYLEKNRRELLPEKRTFSGYYEQVQ